MRNRHRPSPTAPRIIGKHAGCPNGGSVTYTSTGTMGIRSCDGCGASSHRGTAPDTVEEAARFAQLRDPKFMARVNAEEDARDAYKDHFQD